MLIALIAQQGLAMERAGSIDGLGIAAIVLAVIGGLISIPVILQNVRNASLKARQHEFAPHSDEPVPGKV